MGSNAWELSAYPQVFMNSQLQAECRDVGTGRVLRLSEVISAMSYALDITEGQPEGHAVRSCLIGLSIAEELKLGEQAKDALFYALLLKDLGCSSNSARMCSLFEADDRKVKHDAKLVNWANQWSAAWFSLDQVRPGATFFQRLSKVAGMAKEREATSRQLVKIRCERGADITRMMGFPDQASKAILTLDEHFDGSGYPLGMSGDEIPLAGRICSLAQTMEVFIRNQSLRDACDVAKSRRGTWFDPELVDIFLRLAQEPGFYDALRSSTLREDLSELEPVDHIRKADEATLDRVALAFAHVIDAKSPWTSRHSQGVADLAVGIAGVLGYSEAKRRELRWAGWLHDIGKLGVSNLILDKPGKLTDAEFAEMKTHTVHTQRILRRVQGFQDFADYASAHHERLDGSGYHRGLGGEQISVEARILAVADVCEALSADRPYRSGLDPEFVLNLFKKESGRTFCPEVVEAFQAYVQQEPVFERLKENRATLT